MNMETVENELDAKEKISEVFRMGRQLDRLVKRYEDRVSRTGRPREDGLFRS